MSERQSDYIKQDMEDLITESFSFVSVFVLL